jgi:hypothetical protein
MKTRGLIVTLLLVAFAFADVKAKFSRSIFCQADFTEAWTGSLPWTASQNRVDGHVFRYEKLARVRDGDLAVIGWRQDVIEVHYTDESEQEIS